jgi:L-lactate dehydrogenase complex protein LldE
MDVALFVTCLTDTFYPRVGEAVVRVLRHFGCRVHFPEGQTCCGQPAYNSGFHAEARHLVRRMTGVFGAEELVVTPSASCATMVRAHGPALFHEDPVLAEEAARLGERTCEFSTFLRDELDVDVAEYVRFDEPVTFHYPCHARSIYSLAELHSWLAPGRNDVRVPARADLCCGFGGVFAVEFPEISGTMLGAKLEQLSATGAELVVSNEAACTLQMSGGARRAGMRLRFKHLAEVLAESLGLMEGTV